MPAKKRYPYLYATFIVLAMIALFSFSPKAHADVLHPQCDYLNDPTPGGPWSGQGMGCASPIGEDLTLYGAEVYIATNTGGYWWVYIDGVATYTGVEVPPGTGYISTYWPGIPVLAANTVEAFISASSTVPTGGSTTVLGYPYTSAANIYRQLYFSPSSSDDTSTSQVLRINEPASLETTASTTVSVSFDFVVSDSLPARAYEIAAERLAGGGGITYFRGELYDLVGIVTPGVVYTGETDISLPAEGTYKLSVRLLYHDGEDVNEAPVLYTVDVGKSLVFSAVVVDYVAGASVPGRSYVIYPPESCEISWDTGFNFGDCMGYLFSPGPDAWTKYSTLTLRNSFPFSYVYQFPAIKDALYANENTADQAITVSILGGTLTFLSRDMVAAVPFAPLIREMLSAVMWFLLVYSLYTMVLRSHDNHTRI